MTFPLSAPASHAVAAATILGLALIAAPTALHAAAAKPTTAERVEARIKNLHDKLRITTSQSVQWDAVAQVMRTHAMTMSETIAHRSDKANSMTAMDDLRSYQQVAQAHTDGLSQFIPVFANLYDGMSVQQKRNADLVFSQAQHHRAAKSSTITSKVN